MRYIPWIAVAVLLTSANIMAQQANAPASFDCFEDLAPPEFPESALRARVDGTVWTWTEVSPQGVPGKIDTQVVSAWADGAKLLTPPVEKAIRAAKVKPECHGKTVAAVFRYQLYGEATANPKVTSRRDGPNLMWIESQPAAAGPAKP